MVRRTPAPALGRPLARGGGAGRGRSGAPISRAALRASMAAVLLLAGYLYARALRAVQLGSEFSGGGGGGGAGGLAGPPSRAQRLGGWARVAAGSRGNRRDAGAPNDPAGSPDSKGDDDAVESGEEESNGLGLALGDGLSGEGDIGLDDDAEGQGQGQGEEGVYRTPWYPGPPPTPAWHLENDPDDSFERVFISESEKSNFKHLRNLGKGGDVAKGAGVRHFFNPLCFHYRFNHTSMPTVSVIMTTQNEPDAWVSISVESILARTPPELLVDLIVVDDNGVPGHMGLPPNIRKNVDEAEWDYIKSLSPKVQVIKHDNREGCARSRLAGARVARGEVLMFVDSHIEMLSSTWYHHLAMPIMDNPRTIAMQTIDIIDDLGTKDYGSGVGPLQYGIVNTEFWFGYQADRFGDYMEPLFPENFSEEELVERRKMKYKVEVPHTREPYETPFGPGSLFAIRADEFWRLGGYDEGLYVWGGENTELAFKMWMCGGRMLMVPCSRVGHMYRQHKEKDGRGALSRWPPTLPQEMTDRLGCAYEKNGYKGKFIVLRHPADNFTRITTRNNLRVMEGWVGDHPAKKAYYKRMFGEETLKPEFQRFVDEWKVDPVAQKQMRIKEDNKCHDFDWWDKHVYMRLTGRRHPWHPENKKYQKVSCGNHKAKNCQACPQGNGKDWCNGDCTWCDLLEQCQPIDEKGKLCRRKPQGGIGAKAKEMAARRNLEKQGKLGGGEKLHLKPRERAKLTDATRKVAESGLTLSVVLPCGFEHDFFMRTAESVFYETPQEVLKEIVLVDDASEPRLEDMWPKEDAAKFGVKYVRLDAARGLIGAKQAGAEAATGDILVFFDCHVKPAEDYWVPYVEAVRENYRRVVVPTITNLNVDTWEESGRPAAGSGGGMSKCYLTFDAEFKWTTDDTAYVPIMSGGLLAMGRKWFFEIGGYDSSMKGWGGENLDQSLRVWRCGGEIVSAPSSYVAHMWRDGTSKTKARYKLGAGDAVKNRARAVKAHVGRWYEKVLTFPSFKQWRGQDLDISSITEGFSKLECQDFEWYLQRFRNIYRDAGVLPQEVFQIEALPETSAVGGNSMCLELKTMHWTNYGSPDEVVLKECVGSSPSEPRAIWWHLSNRLKEGNCCGSLRAWNTDQCIDGRNLQLGRSKVLSGTCDLDSGLEVSLESADGNGELLLKVGAHEPRYCVSSEGGTSLKIVDCEKASKWRKRHGFTPVEYELLGAESKKRWVVES